jgi:hypothetical protein
MSHHDRQRRLDDDGPDDATGANPGAHPGAAPAAAAPDAPTAVAAPRHLVYRRDDHVWRFQWDDSCDSALHALIADLADRNDPAFDWIDAAVVSHCLTQTFAQPSTPTPDAL